MAANYFELVKNPNWTLYQYHVDFEPEIPSKGFRRALFYQIPRVRDKNLALDGSTFFSIENFGDFTETVADKKSERSINIKVRLVDTVDAVSEQGIRQLNLIFKRFLFL